MYFYDLFVHFKLGLLFRTGQLMNNLSIMCAFAFVPVYIIKVDILNDFIGLKGCVINIDGEIQK